MLVTIAFRLFCLLRRPAILEKEPEVDGPVTIAFRLFCLLRLTDVDHKGIPFVKVTIAFRLFCLLRLRRSRRGLLPDVFSHNRLSAFLSSQTPPGPDAHYGWDRVTIAFRLFCLLRPKAITDKDIAKHIQSQSPFGFFVFSDILPIAFILPAVSRGHNRLSAFLSSQTAP